MTKLRNAANRSAAHYNLCRRHSAVKVSPAMAAHVVGELWSLDRLMQEIGL
jgi:hypothetical protein